MPIVKGESLIGQIKDANPDWFSPENKRFFGDIAYYGRWGKSGKPYLIQYTNAWTDMFDRKSRPHYRIHTIHESSGEIDKLLDGEFETMEDIREWLKSH